MERDDIDLQQQVEALQGYMTTAQEKITKLQKDVDRLGWLLTMVAGWNHGCRDYVDKMLRQEWGEDD